MSTTIACTGGGTGGHVFPGIAVIEQLKKMDTSHQLEIVWIGSGKEIERSITARFDVPYYSVPSGKLRRYFSLQNFLDVFRLIAGFFSSLYLLKKLRAEVLFSKGGYVAVAPVLAARLLKIPILTHESDRDPGLATRIAARYADFVLLPYEATLREYYSDQKERALVTGNPVREELFSGDFAHGRELLNVPPEEPILLVLGGSQGARQINQLLGAILPRLLEKAVVVHQMGELDYRPSDNPRYITTPLFHSEFSHILAAADLVISRAGAGTLWESGVLGKASILVPLGGESSRGDQVRNAELFAQRGGAVVLQGASLTPEVLLHTTERLLLDKQERENMGRSAGELCPSDAAGQIARLIYAQIPAKRGAEGE